MMMKKSRFSSVVVKVLIIAIFMFQFNVFTSLAVVASPPIAGSVISVSNNYGTADTVYIASGLGVGDVVRVYNTATIVSPLGSGTVSSGTSLTVTLTTGLATGVGTAYVSVQKAGASYLESIRVAKAYTSETSSVPVLSNVSTENFKTGVNDTMTVNGLLPNDQVKVYATSTATTPIVTSNSVSSGTTSIVISQLNMFATSTAGSVYITVKGAGKRESTKLTVPYKTDVTTTPIVSNFVVKNAKSSANDTMIVSGVTSGDIVKVYFDARFLSANYTSSAVTAGSTSLTITSSSLFNTSSGGTVYVTITNVDKYESTKTAISYGSDMSVIPTNIAFTPTNNKTSVNDSLVVSGLQADDIVNIYESLTSTVAVGTSGSVASGQTSVTFTSVNMFANSNGGTVYATVTSLYKNESAARVALAYPSDVSTEPRTITIVQNPTGTLDTVTVTGLAVGDVIKVYSTASGGTALGTSSAVSGSATQVTLSVNLNPRGGSAYVTAMRANKSESIRVAKAFQSEPVSTQTLISRISGTNQKSSVADTMVVTTLAVGDQVYVYDALTGGNELGHSSAIASGTVANLSIANLLPNTAGGQVYVAIKNPNKLESSRVAFGYGTDKSAVPVASNFTLFNAASSVADTIDVSSLSVGNTIRIYSSETGGTLLAEDAVTSGTTLSFSAVDLLPTSTNGQVYATLETSTKSESDRIVLFYDSDQSLPLLSGQVTVTNHKKGVADTIDITSLPEAAVIYVYDGNGDSANLLATSAAVASGSTSTTISGVDLLEASGDTFYISVTNDDMGESERIAITYSAEQIATILDPTQVTIVNNKAGQADSITVSGMTTGDTIYVYTSSTATTPTQTVNYASGTTIVISANDLLTAGSDRGTIYLAITNADKSESPKLSCDYLSDKTPTLFSSQIAITQTYTGAADQVVVSGLRVGDVVKWYDTSTKTNLIRQGTVSSGTSYTFSGTDWLTSTGGDVYLTVTSNLKTESVIIGKSYASEPRTTLSISGLSKSSLNNRSGVADTFTVSGLAAGDVVIVYDSSTGGNEITRGSVASGATSVTISFVDMFDDTTGNVYVSIMENHKLEAVTRTSYTYATVAQTADIDSSNVLVKNYVGTTNDTITIFGLHPLDEINIYSNAAATIQKCEATTTTNCTWAVSGSGNSVTVTDLAGLSDTAGGTFYVTVQNTTLDVSDPVIVYYSNARTVQPIVSSVAVTNSEIGTNDSLVITGLSSADVVKVYAAASGGSAIAGGAQTECASSCTGGAVSGQLTFGGSEFLTDTGGDIYVTITSTNKLESNRTKVTYNAINQTATPTTIAIVNYPASVADDSITISGYTDTNLTYVVKVYNATTNALLSTSGTISLDGSNDIVYDGADIIAASNAGNVKITVTQSTLLESAKSTSKAFTNDYTAPVASAAKVQVFNDDTNTDIVRVKISGLLAGDLVFVYETGTSTDYTSGGYTALAGDATAGYVKITGLTLIGAGGSVDVTVKRGDYAESSAVSVAYAEE